MGLRLKSERQIQAEILSKLIAQAGINDVNAGSVIDIITQAVAQQDFSLYYQIAQVSRLADIESMSGQDLDNKAFEYGLSRIQASKAKGTITIFRPAGFVKVSTSFYAGAVPPSTGDMHIDVNDASSLLIGTSGSLILGRGSNNEEIVTYSVAPINNTTFYRIILDNPLTKDHAIEESVILKQGNDEIISAGTVVLVPATGASSEIQFETDVDVILLSGEDRVTGVEITAIEPGTASNISLGAIDGESAFASPPFSGARARNESKITTGVDLESDDAFRDRIKNYVQGITRAVKQAIYNAIVGLVDPETAKRVVSANIILPIEVAGDVKVYIDDGQGFEPSFNSKGFEVVLARSTGGEQRLQVDMFPIVKAQAESNAAEPFNMSGGIKVLNFQVGDVAESVSFYPADFKFPEIATAEEIVTVINNRSTLIEARTSEVGKYVTLMAKSDTNEDLQVMGGNANDILSFPLDLKSTINLYIDDVKLNKDGKTAILDSNNSAPFNLLAIGPFPHELRLEVDGKSANIQTATLNIVDVQNPSAVTTEEIVKVLNRDLVGIEASSTENNSKVRIASLTKLSSKSGLRIASGSLNNSIHGLNMPTTLVIGANNDYKFNRELGTIELTRPLVANQSVTLGSQFTRAKLIATSSELYSPQNGETLIFEVDGQPAQTVVFDNTFAAGATAQEVANFMNRQLQGATAVVREIGNGKFVQVSTNTYDSTGSIRLSSFSTANSAFGFLADTLIKSDFPNKAYAISSTGPFHFAENDNLIIVVDNDIVNATYSVQMAYKTATTNVSSSQIFYSSNLSNTFPNQGQILDYFVAFTSGAATTNGSISTVSKISDSIARYTFDGLLIDMASYIPGDLIKFENLSNESNNGSFLINSIGNDGTNDYIQVINRNAEPAQSQTGSATLSQKRRIQSYNNVTGEIVVLQPFSNVPATGDSFVLIPTETLSVVDYLRNTKVTSLSLKAQIEAADGSRRVQISSKSEGSDGYIQITGGGANSQLNFSTSMVRGIAAYSYWTGLLALVHKTIYGDDSDLSAFPGYGAAGITFRVLAPTVQQISVELDVTLADGVSISSLENEIKSAVSGYINTLGVGDDIIIERIRAAVIAIPGITDVSISSPTANVAIADNEIAKIADPDILIG